MPHYKYRICKNNKLYLTISLCFIRQTTHKEMFAKYEHTDQTLLYQTNPGTVDNTKPD